MSALLEVSDYTGGYAGASVVRNLSLSVNKGEVVALLGPNGSGKTTTLLSASGLLPIISGDIRIDGHSVRRERPHRIARMGMAHVPDDRSLFFRLSVRQNLELGAHYNRSEIDSVLLLFPALAELMDRRAELLSGGEQQMLALARALASKPRLLLVDELSMGLAPIIVERVLPILRTAADAGIGVLLVEPHPQGALGIADRAYVLAHGDLVLEGDARYVSDNMEKVEESYLGKLDEPASRM